jgi:mannose-1-phosphate guanylyltransferase/mannose-1-phosphate guanylyltransferase/mannose-6-phosphate isomerase
MATRPKIFPVLLSGGAGTRLWPLSREATPKQLIRLVGGETLFQQAALRVAAAAFEPLTVIGGAPHRFLLAEQLREVGAAGARIVIEPVGRNTAAAAAIAALVVVEREADALVLLAPADHIIDDDEAFRATVQRAMPAARDGRLVLFGIAPDAPATGYGYIRVGGSRADGVRDVAAFVEKPDRATAEAYLRSGDHLWNSGIVLARASVLLEELEAHEPGLVASARAALAGAETDADFTRLDAAAYECCRAIPFDRAVLERSGNVAVVPAAFGWRDVGSWASLWQAAERDADENVVVGNVVAEATKGSYLRSEGPLLATLGVENLVVVATPDAILVAARDRDQDIGAIVERLREKDASRR